MNKEEIEDLAFKNRKELANVNELDLLEIIEFLQLDRKQWINQYSKAHNDYVDLQRKYDQVKEIEEEHRKINGELREENRSLKSQLDFIYEQNKYIEKLEKRIDKTIEYINKYESIKAYYEYIDEDGYDEYSYDEGFKKELLEILKGDSN